MANPDNRIPEQQVVSGRLCWRMRCAVHHAGMQPFDRAAGGCHAQGGQHGMNQRRQACRKQRASEAESDPICSK